MNEKKVLLRFHLGNKRERKAWELLLQRKQQNGCSYRDVVMDALLAGGDHATEIFIEQEDRIVERIKATLASSITQIAGSDTPAPSQEITPPEDIPDELASYALIDWNYPLGGND